MCFQHFHCHSQCAYCKAEPRLRRLSAQFIYSKIAHALNDAENHRTPTEYNDALILKTFLFESLNNYLVLFYIAYLEPFCMFVCGCCCVVLLNMSLVAIFFLVLSPSFRGSAVFAKR